jgi:hypothetical protein
MSRPDIYELEEEEEVGGRRFPAENGELLRLDEDEEDGRDDIADLAPQRPQGDARTRRWGAARHGTWGSEVEEGRYPKVRGFTWPAPFQKRREAAAS